MTETETPDQAVEPWAVAGEPGGFYDTPPGFLAPGDQAALLREEARLLAEEKRKESERADRADMRQTAAMFEARQHALHRGLPWDPTKPFEHMPSIYARADAMFAVQDAEARRADRQAAEAAGLVHLLHQGVPSPHPGPAAGGTPPPASRFGSPSSGPGVAARASLLDKIRGARDRWAHRATTRVDDGSRPLDGSSRMVTRSTYQYRRTP